MSALIARRTEFWWSERQRPRPASRRARPEAVTVRRSAIRTRRHEGRGASAPPANSAAEWASGGSKGGGATPRQSAMVESRAGAVPLGYAASSAHFRVGA